MPPYNARSGENRRKAHRALLIGVDRYEHLGRLPSVPRNLELMKEALTAEGSGVFDPDEVRVLLDPRGRHTVDAALSKAAEEAEGLLVVYFVGHGQVDTYGRNFHLMVAGSKVTRDKSHPFSNALAWHKDVMHWLWESEAEHIVVILDCCYAGNALKELDLNPEKRFALFAAIREGAEIPVARSAGGTRFTREIHRVLTEEPAEGGPLRGGDVLLAQLDTRVREALAGLKAYDGQDWIPVEFHQGDDVVLALGQGEGEGEGADSRYEREPKPDFVPEHDPGAVPHDAFPPRFRNRLWRRRGVRRSLVPLLVLALLGTAGVIVRNLLPGGGGGGCAPSMELRVLTDPDLRATVQKAANAYTKRNPRACRRIGITVYEAKETDAVAAFQGSKAWQSPDGECPASGACFRPQRDLGAQPDIWIPAADSTWRRAQDTSAAASGTGTAARAGSVVSFDRLGPLAFTPMVLAVPDGLSLPPALQTGSPLSGLVSELRSSEPAASVLRSDPEITDGALLATTALYPPTGTAQPSELEQGMAGQLTPMPGTASELMCALAASSENTLEDRAAVLIPEQTMAQFNLRPGDKGRQSCAKDTLSARTAWYPSDVPMLDLPFVHVTWKGAERDAAVRKRAVEDFYRWLTKDVSAQRVFTEDGFRGVTSDRTPAPPDEHSLLKVSANTRAVHADALPPTGPRVTSAVQTDTLRRYREALGPGRVLYLLDTSTSMADKRVLDGSGRAKDLVSRSMNSLGAKDEYGVRSLAPASRKSRPDVVPFGRNDRAAAQRKVDAVKPVNTDARVATGLREALADLRGGPAELDPPRLLVLVTDDEDSAAIKGAALASLVKEAKKAPRVRVVVVSLQGGGCTSGELNRQLTAATGGRCLDPSVDLAKELQAEVAKTGTGDAE
ncbi:substrate-binding domain-containing protein [Streptomyces sp. NBC_00873]|uniref:vWA domain-containing protein n=1 Tax=Streptomyces sp. NBC_00873 TaxID=2975852 RepID=UPI00386CFE84|nr:substrate-binding domain-containing protein [Streptomyces sp. NBC_00873]